MSRRDVWYRRAIGGMIVLALVQVGVLTSLAREQAGPPLVEPGHSFGEVDVLDAQGSNESLATGGRLLVLVFHSECGHCEVIAPVWAEWLHAPPRDLPIVAVSNEPHPIASAYASRHEWPVAVRSVRSPRPGSDGFELTRRTPWVFGLDAEGRVVSTGHGSEIERVAAELAGEAAP